jgi:phosphoribosylanthranilate isomerase
MSNLSATRVKICCISSQEEARLAVQAGASALGLVSRMPSGPGVISDALIAQVAARVPPAVASFLLTCEQDADALIAQQRAARTNTLQLCDAVNPGTYRALREALPGVSLVQVIHVEDEASVDEALAAAAEVDGLLLDSGRPKQAIKELGGTGRVHDWKLSRRIRERAGVPVFLAGGLNADNVADAIRQVEPFGVDVCSGVRTNGALDGRKLTAFLERVRGA